MVSVAGTTTVTGVNGAGGGGGVPPVIVSVTGTVTLTGVKGGGAGGGVPPVMVSVTGTLTITGLKTGVGESARRLVTKKKPKSIAIIRMSTLLCCRFKTCAPLLLHSPFKQSDNNSVLPGRILPFEQR